MKITIEKIKVSPKARKLSKEFEGKSVEQLIEEGLMDPLEPVCLFGEVVENKNGRLKVKLIK